MDNYYPKVDNSDGWTSEWPTEPGHYLFYGWLFKWSEERKRTPSLYPITVNEGTAYFEGEAALQRDAGHGLWLRVEPSELPIDKLKEMSLVK